MRICPARVHDADALTDLHLDVWDEAYTDLIAPEILAERRAGRSDRVATWRQMISGHRSTPLLAWAEDGSELLGFVTFGPGRDEPENDLPGLEIMALYVRAAVYGQGVGYALLKEAIGSAPAYLWVLDGNRRAVAFYERQGFRFDGAAKTEAVGVERRMVRAVVQHEDGAVGFTRDGVGME